MSRVRFKDLSMQTSGDREEFRIATHTIMPGDSQYEDDECTLPICEMLKGTKLTRKVFRAKNRFLGKQPPPRLVFIEEKSLLFINSRRQFAIDHIIKHVPVCDAKSRVAAAMVSKLRVHGTVQADTCCLANDLNL
ncbi:hypothetical protein TNCV_3162661 [Trichonephila clavipes]|nr:hypothetical protein TNCV_3162661 [Trichonephila clavipes]